MDKSLFSSFFSIFGNDEKPKPTPTLSSETSTSNFLTDYYKFDHYDHKKKVIENLLRGVPSEKEFQIGLDYLLKEPDTCNYRIDLFEHFVKTYKNVVPISYRENILRPMFLKDFLGKTDYLEYMAILLIDYRDKNEQYYVELMRLMADKIHRMPKEIQIKRFYLEELIRFQEFKKNNEGQPYTTVDPLRVNLLKKAVQILYEGFFRYLAPELDYSFASAVLVNWLFVLDPLTDKNEFELVSQITQSIAQLMRRFTNEVVVDKVWVILIRLIDCWRISFSYKDSFKGYKNLILAFDLLDSRAITDCVYNPTYFQEIFNLICKSRYTLVRVLHNLVAVNCVQNAGVFIKALSENLLFRNMYDLILIIFQEIICPYLIPKLKVLRGFKENLELCELYFYGLSRVGLSLNESVLQSFFKNLRFLTTHVYKEPPLQPLLKQYIDFVDAICYLYQRSPADKLLFERLCGVILKCRNEFEHVFNDQEFSQRMRAIEKRAWNTSFKDLKKSRMLSVTDSLTHNFRKNNMYKGVKNIGNTCYLASTMQALFMSIDFRVKLINLHEEELNRSQIMTFLKNTFTKEEPNQVLKETESLFYQLLTTEEQSVNPDKLKESLPDQFKLANQEQDTLEFLQVYFDCLENELKETSDKTLVDDLFGGETLNTWECQECFKARTKKTKFIHIGLNFDGKEKARDDQIRLIKRAFHPDSFEEEGSVFCQNCQKKSLLTTQSTEILKLPPYLIMSFNRFYFDQGEQKGAKIFTNVEIYQYLDLKDILKEQVKAPNAQYQLYAIIVHRGFTTERGHYFTLIRDTEDLNLWILLNDSLSYSMQEGKTLNELLSEYENDTPYLLFYRQHKPRTIV